MSLEEEFKVAKTGTALSIRESKDKKVAEAGVVQSTGRKWSATEAIQAAEARLRQEEIGGIICHGKQGIGYRPSRLWSREDANGRREQVQKKIRQEEEENRIQRAVGMSKQGAWMNWTNVMSRKISWDDMWKSAPYALKFLICSVYDLLPTPSNLHLWGKREEADCPLCGRRGNLEHILSSCKTALSQGRYRWRHDQVLRELATGIEEAKQEIKVTGTAKFIRFVKESSLSSSKRDNSHGLLPSAGDWRIEVDVGKQLRFPKEIVITRLRPDMVIWSPTTKQVILIELTVPWEERTQEAYERKRLKYQDLMLQCAEAGWRLWCFPVEVGTRGFPGNSLWRMMEMLGLNGKMKKK